MESESLNYIHNSSVVQETDDAFDDFSDILVTNVTLVFNHTEMVDMSASLRITLYTIIFILSLSGNFIVIITLLKNRHMRTMTNFFLVNLAVGDLLLGVFCMPFTLVGSILRNFIFGRNMCTILSYLQAVSVAVNAYTLVAISMERFFAICQPLHSRGWQTHSHSYKVLAIIWTLAASTPLPIAVFTEYIEMSDGRHKCREKWPSEFGEKAFWLTMDVVLFVIPLLVMTTVYTIVAITLWKDHHVTLPTTEHERNMLRRFSECSTYSEMVRHPDAENGTLPRRSSSLASNTLTRIIKHHSSFGRIDNTRPSFSYDPRTQATKSLINKRRIIKMLFMVVAEFFICWTPLYVINTWALFDPVFVYSSLSPAAISYIQLLAYLSSCNNPITYCFFNEKFRVAFLIAFGCRDRSSRISGHTSCSTHTARRRLSEPVPNLKISRKTLSVDDDVKANRHSASSDTAVGLPAIREADPIT